MLTEVRLNRKCGVTFDLITCLEEKGKKINPDEFVEIIQGSVGKLVTKEGLQKIFNRYDKKGEGKIDVNDIVKIVQYLGDCMEK